MCAGIAFAWSQLPSDLIARYHLERRVHERGGEREIQFLYRDRDRILPVWHEGQLLIVSWGNGRGQTRYLPRTGWTWQATLDDGGWSYLEVAPVDIPATMGLENGIWYRVRQGMRGLLAFDERGRPAVYMLCEPASHYYQIMTRSRRMPVLINERI
jgi:hypothetical protein